MGWDRRLGRPSEIDDEVSHVRLKRIGNLKDLNEVKPSFTALVFRHERLRPPQCVGELDLGESPGMARLDEPIAQSSVGWTEEGSGHGRCHTIVAGTLVADSGYPNLG
jgi:hypothetical protein